jgi:diguanylate cyclase (GGDEF)-like protein/PAS domain S-box-containing protein
METGALPAPGSVGPELRASASAPSRLRALLALAVGLLMLAAWGFFAATESLAQASVGDAEALTLAGRQSHLAQRLANLAIAPSESIDAQGTTKEILARMMVDAGRLHDLRGHWGSLSDGSDHWTTRRERLWAAMQAYQMAQERGEHALYPYADRIRREADRFVVAMDAATAELQAAAEQRQHQTQHTHTTLVVGLALLVSLVLWGLGEPLARRMARHHASLAAQSQQLNRLAMVADRTQNAVVISDAEGRLIWANDAFTRFTGYTLAEAQGQIPGQLLQFEGTDPATRATLRQALAAGDPVRVEVLNRGKHGRSYWVDLDIQPLRGEQGEVSGFIAVETDITAQVQRREYLDAVLRALPAGMVVHDAHGHIVDANLRAEQLLQISRAELMDRESHDRRWAAVHEDGRPMAAHEHPSVVTLRTGQAQEGVPMGVQLPDGQRRWLRANTQILASADGHHQGVISCFVDETETRVQRNLLQTTIDGAGVGTWDWDIVSGLVRYNERWARMMGLALDEVPRTLEGWQLLLHPDDGAHTRSVLQAHLADPGVPYRTEFRMRGRTGDWTWVMAAGAVIERGADGRARRMTGVHVDITERKKLEQALSDAALTDALTRLPNRAGIQQALARCVARANADRSSRFAVLFMDFDRFKLVNDSLGHDAGDELLRQIARRVKLALRPSDDVARLCSEPVWPDVAGRLGGDEFVVLLDRIARPDDAVTVAQRLLEALAAPYDLCGRQVQSTASIGVVTSDVSCESVESVLRDADTAMYEAKRRGRGRHVVFQPDMHQRIRQALELEADMRLALQDDSFYVVYQPIVDLASRRPVGLEALARWRHTERGVVSPVDFIPIAEETGLIVDLGRRVLRRACLDLARWQAALGPGAPRTVSVNLSRAQLQAGVLAATVRSALAEAGLAASALRLEITETLAMQDEAAVSVLGELRALGVSLSLDDFGTGYSSLASLDQLPIDTVKIDRAFVAKMVSSSYQTALVKSTVQVAEALALAVIAEGVETEAQAQALTALGCHGAQGFLFSRPVPAPELEAWWRQQGPAAAAPALAEPAITASAGIQPA